MKRWRFSILGLFVVCALTGRAAAQAHFLRGDSNLDKAIDITDGVATLGYLFLGTAAPPCLDGADTNDSGALDIADAIYVLNFLFSGGPAPAAPYPNWEGDPTPDDGLGCLASPENPIVEVVGDITTDQNWVRTKVYRLSGGVFIKDGATVTVEAGTTVLGKEGTATTAGLLVVERGGKLIAVGTPTHPVVFTSEKPVGQRGKSNWGGIIMLGRAQLNVAGGVALAEGLPNSQYGGGANPDNNDSSGQLSYVRIEFGGVAISQDNEVNGLSMFSVGAATQLDHIQVKYNDDDSFEWFGGTARLKYGLATGVTDDGPDYAFGWQGRLQFFVSHQNKDDAQTGGNGFEVDNSEPPIGTFGDTPFTNPIVSNVTIIGGGDPSTGKGGQGMLIRRGAGSRIYNGVVMGWRLSGFDIDDAATTGRVDSGDLVVDHMVFYQNGPDGTMHCQPADSETTTQKEDDPANAFLYTSCSFIQTKMTNNVFATQSPVVRPFDLTNPDFRPQNDALTAPFNASALDSWFDAAAYRGGVPPSGDDWTKERWTSFLRN